MAVGIGGSADPRLDRLISCPKVCYDVSPTFVSGRWKRGGPPWRCFQDPRLAINSLKEHSDCPETQEHVFFGWFQAFDLCATCTGYSGPLGMTKLGSDSLNCPGLSLLCQWISATSLSISYIVFFMVITLYSQYQSCSLSFIIHEDPNVDTWSKSMFTLWQANMTMEHHHFSWVNQLFQWPCSIALCMFTRGYELDSNIIGSYANMINHH